MCSRSTSLFGLVCCAGALCECVCCVMSVWRGIPRCFQVSKSWSRWIKCDVGIKQLVTETRKTKHTQNGTRSQPLPPPLPRPKNNPPFFSWSQVVYNTPLLVGADCQAGPIFCRAVLCRTTSAIVLLGSGQGFFYYVLHDACTQLFGHEAARGDFEFLVHCPVLHERIPCRFVCSAGRVPVVINGWAIPKTGRGCPSQGESPLWSHVVSSG